MIAGSIWSAAFPRKKVVSRTPSGCRSRSSCARSSSPVASGTRDLAGLRHVHGGRRTLVAFRQELLGALGVVALTPAQARVVLDHRTQLEDAVHQRLGA